MKNITTTKRVYFIVADNAHPAQAYLERVIDFDWYMGMNWQMRVKSSLSLRQHIQVEMPDARILEVSTKSDNFELGKALSAFNLKLGGIPIENIFQSSKVMSDGGPYPDLLTVQPAVAKRDPRLQAGKTRTLISFVYQNHTHPTEPKSFFYDHLYITALSQNAKLLDEVTKYNVFTDIEFNQKVPYADKKGPFSCQARACAICVWLVEHGMLEDYLKTPEQFIGTIYPHPTKQSTLFST